MLSRGLACLQTLTTSKAIFSPSLSQSSHKTSHWQPLASASRVFFRLIFVWIVSVLAIDHRIIAFSMPVSVVILYLRDLFVDWCFKKCDWIHAFPWFVLGRISVVHHVACDRSHHHVYLLTFNIIIEFEDWVVGRLASALEKKLDEQIQSLLLTK